MLSEQTVDRLQHLRLAAMAEAYLAQQRDTAAASLTFDERLGMLVDAEQLARENRALRRRLHEAKLKFTQACLWRVASRIASRISFLFGVNRPRIRTTLDVMVSITWRMRSFLSSR
jgi:hypothetical protein